MSRLGICRNCGQLDKSWAFSILSKFWEGSLKALGSDFGPRLPGDVLGGGQALYLISARIHYMNSHIHKYINTEINKHTIHNDFGPRLPGDVMGGSSHPTTSSRHTWKTRFWIDVLNVGPCKVILKWILTKSWVLDQRVILKSLLISRKVGLWIKK